MSSPFDDVWRPSMESYYEDITPAMAKKYLVRHAAERNLNANAVSNYARDMAAGHWQLTHQAIAFTEDGLLLDGQHRLHAIIKANKTISLYVTKGVDPAVFGVLDSGRQRSLADRFKIEGNKHATQLASVGRRATLWQLGHPWTRGITPTREEIAKTIEDIPELVEAAAYAHSWPARRIMSPATAGFCWWLFGTVDPQDRDMFMNQVRTGEGLQASDPALVLRERLMTRHAPGPRATWMRPEALTALTIYAWRSFRRRKPLTKLQLPSILNDETFPRPD